MGAPIDSHEIVFPEALPEVNSSHLLSSAGFKNSDLPNKLPVVRFQYRGKLPNSINKNAKKRRENLATNI